MIDQLIEIIGREAVLFESFLALLEKQQELLVKNDVNGLNEITDRQREKLVESQLLNQKREELVAAIKREKQVEGDLNVTRLLELVDKNQAEQLKTLRTVINELNGKINEVRNQNAILLNRSRKYIHKTMEMLAKLHQPEDTYSASGATESGYLNVAIDRRA